MARRNGAGRIPQQSEVEVVQVDELANGDVLTVTLTKKVKIAGRWINSGTAIVPPSQEVYDRLVDTGACKPIDEPVEPLVLTEGEEGSGEESGL